MRRHLLFVALSAGLLAITVISLLHAPISATDRLRPIPVYAQLVYNDETPDWFLSFFPTLGSREARQAQNFPMFGKLEEGFSNPWKKSFQPLEKKPLAVATVSFGEPTARPAWIAVSELGGPAALALRWKLMLSPPEEVRPARPYASWPVWTLEHPSLPRWARIRFSLTEGLLICSISGDSHDIYKLLDALDGRTTSMADRRNP